MATELTVTARTVSAYERQGAPAEVCAEMARVLRCPERFFSLGPIEPLEEERVFFRARRRASATQRHAATAAGRIGIELYGWIDSRYRLPDPDLPDLDDQCPADAAVAIRAMWGLGLEPLPNLVQLAESRGVRVLSLPQGAEDVDAFSVWSDGRPYVFLSRTKTPERSRFDLAHELGHLVLHSRRGLGEPEAGVEREADRFASEFLMPPQSLRTGIRQEPSAAEIITAKSHFKVSAMALTYALHEVGRLGDWGYRQNCNRLSQMGYRNAEPDGLTQHEKSRVFQVVFDDLRQNHAMGAEQVAAEMGIHASELHALTLGAAMYGLRARGDGAGPSSQPADGARRPRLRLVHG